MKKLTFKYKLILFAVIVGILPLVATGSIVYNVMKQNLESAIYRASDLYLEVAIGKINSYFVERYGDADVIKSTDNIRRIVTTQDYAGTSEDISFLKNTKEVYGYSFLFVTDTSGKITVSDNQAIIGADLSSRDYIKKALSGDENWSDMFFSNVVNTNAMVLCSPVEIDGKIQGTLGIAIAQEVVDGLIHTGVKRLGESGDSYLVNADKLLYSDTLLGDFQNDAALKETVDSEGTQMLSEAIRSGNESYRNVGTYLDYLNNPVLGSLGVAKIGDQNLGLVIEVDVAEAMAPVKKLRNLLLIILISAVGVIIVVGFLLARSIIMPVRSVNDMLRDIAEGEGDLTKRLVIETDDEFGELGRLFNIFIGKLQKLISEISESVENLASSTSQIAVSIDDSNNNLDVINHNAIEVNDGISGNTSVVEETNAAVEEITSSSMVISEKAMEISGSNAEVLEATKHGSESLRKARESIEIVENLSGNMEGVMVALSGSTNEIKNIVGIITGISDQVNLLALNAAIEAARAGELGRGFAVVADEIRKLAEESKTSAENIASLINKIVDISNEALESVEKEKSQVQTSVVNIKETDEEIQNIIGRINGVVDLMESINGMLQNQAQVTRDVSKSMDEITKASVHGASSIGEITNSIQSQSSTFEEITASIEELNSMADTLQGEMSKFKV